jgi:4-hydroxymandelate oxidase
MTKPAPRSAPPPAAAPTAVPVDLPDYERRAPEHMSAMAWNYIAGGAGDELTLRWNREAFDRVRLRPRVLVDVSRIDLRVSLLGRERAHPILLAPTAYQRLVHPDGELAVARGAASANAIYVASTGATTSVEDIGKVATGAWWFQLYLQPDRGFTAELVRRAADAGCEALVLTVDAPVLGQRSREAGGKFTLPPGLERANLHGLPAAKGGQRPGENTIYSPQLDPKLSWEDLTWLRGLTKLPVVLKGVLNGADAARAVEHGAAAVIVSNHGGRNLDTLPAALDALPEVVASVGGRVPVLVDGGIRRGTDVLKAFAFGASAVLIGRPYLHGLALRGADGVAHVVNLLRREFEMAMALTGCRTVAEIDRTVLWS